MIPPCLALSNIRYVSRVKWSNPGEGVAPIPTPRWREASEKGAFWSSSNMLANLYICILIYIYIYIYIYEHIHTFIYVVCVGGCINGRLMSSSDKYSLNVCCTTIWFPTEMLLRHVYNCVNSVIEFPVIEWPT